MMKDRETSVGCRWLAGLAVAATVGAPAALAAGAWSVEPSEEDWGPVCYLGYGSAFGSPFGFVAYKRNDEGAYLEAPEEYSEREHVVELVFDSGQRFTFRTGVDEYFGDLRLNGSTAALLSEFAGTRRLDVLIDGRPTRSFDLAGSSSAVDELRRCQSRLPSG